MASLNGEWNRMHTELKKRLAEPGRCRRCSGVVLCIDTDGEPMNPGQWQEYEAGCPVCGRVPPTIRVVYDDEREERRWGA